MKIRSLIRFFDDLLEMKWAQRDDTPVQSTTVPSVTVPRDSVFSIPCPRKVDGYAWLTRNFPQLTTPPPSVGNKSALCKALAMAHLNPACLSLPAKNPSGSNLAGDCFF